MDFYKLQAKGFISCTITLFLMICVAVSGVVWLAQLINPTWHSDGTLSIMLAVSLIGMVVIGIYSWKVMSASLVLEEEYKQSGLVARTLNRLVELKYVPVTGQDLQSERELIAILADCNLILQRYYELTGDDCAELASIFSGYRGKLIAHIYTFADMRKSDSISEIYELVNYFRTRLLVK